MMDVVGIYRKLKKYLWGRGLALLKLNRIEIEAFVRFAPWGGVFFSRNKGLNKVAHLICLWHDYP